MIRAKNCDCANFCCLHNSKEIVQSLEKEEMVLQKKKTWSGKVEMIAAKSQGCAKFTSLHNPDKIVLSLAKEEK